MLGGWYLYPKRVKVAEGIQEGINILEKVSIPSLDEPHLTRTSALWKMFSRCGRVVDIYVAFKRTKRGSKFGFVRFLITDNLESFENRLKIIMIGETKIMINRAKFFKDPRNNMHVRRSDNNKFSFCKEDFPPFMRNGDSKIKTGSFRDVLGGSKPIDPPVTDKCINVVKDTGIHSRLDKCWIDNKFEEEFVGPSIKVNGDDFLGDHTDSDKEEERFSSVDSPMDVPGAVDSVGIEDTPLSNQAHDYAPNGPASLNYLNGPFLDMNDQLGLLPNVNTQVDHYIGPKDVVDVDNELDYLISSFQHIAESTNNLESQSSLASPYDDINLNKDEVMDDKVVMMRIGEQISYVFDNGNSSLNCMILGQIAKRSASGGILTLWDINVFTKEQQVVDPNFLGIIGSWVRVSISPLVFGPVFGDFNVVGSLEERASSIFYHIDETVFNDFISRVALFDFPGEMVLQFLSFVVPSSITAQLCSVVGFLILAPSRSKSLISGLAMRAMEGDENTRFFHSIVKHKIAAFSIKGVQVRPRFNCSLFRKLSVEDVAGAKAPGPCSLNFKFIKAYWEIMKFEFPDCVKYFETSRKITKGCNPSFIGFIPKSIDPLSFSDYRPFSLIGCVYKVISKILALSLAKVIPSIIGPNQMAFLAGRKILDVCLIANESIRMASLEDHKILLFKVDFEKVFNNEFLIEKGLRQGDPLSPFLFLLVAEALQVSIIEACNKGFFKGVCLSDSGDNLSLLQYADDTLFFGKWSRSNANNFILILKCIEEASGLKVNLAKSRIFSMGVDINEGKVVNRVRNRLSAWKGFKKGNRGISWVRWNSILLNHNMGGLGVGSIQAKKLKLLDPWVNGGSRLKDLCPKPFALDSCEDCIVSDSLSISGDGSDKWVWSREASSTFKVNTLSVHLQELMLADHNLGYHHS
nr:putative RNA-directed DNA polymerase, eukaryota [Tanacetum cinerariifolium]